MVLKWGWEGYESMNVAFKENRKKFVKGAASGTMTQGERRAGMFLVGPKTELGGPLR